MQPWCAVMTWLLAEAFTSVKVNTGARFKNTGNFPLTFSFDPLRENIWAARLQLHSMRLLPDTNVELLIWILWSHVSSLGLLSKIANLWVMSYSLSNQTYQAVQLLLVFFQTYQIYNKITQQNAFLVTFGAISTTFTHGTVNQNPTELNCSICAAQLCSCVNYCACVYNCKMCSSRSTWLQLIGLDTA